MSENDLARLIPFAVPILAVTVIGTTLFLQRRNGHRAIRNWATEQELSDLKLISVSLKLRRIPSFGTRLPGDGDAALYQFSATGPDGSPVTGWVSCRFAKKTCRAVRVEAFFDGQPGRVNMSSGFPVSPLSD